MAGYMSGHTNYRYEGTFKNGTKADLPNGMLLALTAVADEDGGEKTWQLTLPAAGKGAFNVVRKRNVFEGTPGVELYVIDGDDLYFVENLILTNDGNEAWNGSEWTVPADALVRAHKVRPGELFVTDQLAAELDTYAVGDVLKTDATGKLTK